VALFLGHVRPGNKVTVIATSTTLQKRCCINFWPCSPRWKYMWWPTVGSRIRWNIVPLVEEDRSQSQPLSEVKEQ